MKPIGEVMTKTSNQFAKRMIEKKFPTLAGKDFYLRELCRKCETCGRFSILFFEIRMSGKPDWKEVPTESKFCIPCENKKMAKDAMASHLSNKAKRTTAQFWMIPPELVKETLATYKPEDPDQMEAFKTAVAYLKDFQKNEFYNLIFRGSYGGGKSHLLKGIAEAVKNTTKKIVHNGIEYDVPVTVGFLDMETLLSMIKGTFGRREGQTEHDIMKEIIELDFLVIDDLGTESGEWAGKKIFEIINGRLGKATAYSTNYMEMSELAKRYPENGGKIVSRLRSNTKIVDLVTDDMREKKTKGIER